MKVYMRIAKSKALGPGTRYILWVQGCHRHCDGCIAENSWDISKGEDVELNTLIDEVVNTDVEGITVSGGEPFLQAEELAKMILEIRKVRDIGVIVYTGYKNEELLELRQKNQGIADFYNQIDLLIDGEYIKELDDNKSLRGSSNQRVIPLTNCYIDDIKKYYEIENGRNVELREKNNEIYIIGIPSKKSEKFIKLYKQK